MAVGLSPTQVSRQGLSCSALSSMSKEINNNDKAYSNRSDHESRVGPTSTRLALAFCTLIEYVAQDIVVAIFVHVMDAHMPITKSATRSDLGESHGPQGRVSNIPLQIVRPWISMLAFRAERADIARTVVHQAVANHLVLAFESFAAFGARAACNWTVVRSALAVHVLVRASEGLLAGGDNSSWTLRRTYFSRY